MKKLIAPVQKTAHLRLLLLFFSFMYVQLVLLRLSNSAGRGYLAESRQELVYCFLQVAVIAGFLLHAALQPRVGAGKGATVFTALPLVFCAAGGFLLLFMSPASLFYLIVTGVTVFSLGLVGGAVYLNASRLFSTAKHAGLCVGGGYAAGVALQFCTQLQWTLLPAVAVLLTLCFVFLAVLLLMKAVPAEDAVSPEKKPVSRRGLIPAAAITAALLLFTVYYTSLIHHLQIQSGYGEYNVYAWPRLLMIPVVLLFGWLGEVWDGRLLPVSTLCAALLALLHTVLAVREAYVLNMCRYYVALAAVVVYYHLTFFRRAASAKTPALWACMGRLLDSAAVVFSFVFRFFALSPAAVLAVDIGLLVLVIVLMALNKDFSFESSASSAEVPPAPVDADPFTVLQERFGITNAEMNVLRELVLTEDKQDVIAARLNISVSTMRHHITSIYRKTDVQSRAGLCKLAAACRS